MEKNFSLKNSWLFLISIYVLLLLSNRYLNLQDAISIGFADSSAYSKIILDSSNSIKDQVAIQQGYRFLIPYFIGILVNFLNIEEYFLLLMFSIIIQLLIIFSLINIISNLGCKKNLSFIIVSAFILNAYNFRPLLISPYTINDWIFMYGLLFIVDFIIVRDKKNYFFFGLVLCAVSRQTVLILNFFFLLNIFYSFFYNKLVKINIYISAIFINILIFVILTFISSSMHSSLNFNTYVKAMLGIFNMNYTLYEFISFIIRFVFSNLFLIILLFFLIINYKSYKRFLNFKILSVGILGLTIWIQPILGGPAFTGAGNIARLTIISLPVLLIFFLLIFKDLEIKFSYVIIILILLLISSMHHNYTIFFNLFNNFKNYHFALLNITSHLIIFFIFLKIRLSKSTNEL